MVDSNVIACKDTSKMEKYVMILMNVLLRIIIVTQMQHVSIQKADLSVFAMKAILETDYFVMMLMNVHKLIGVIKMDFVSIHQEVSNVCV